MSALIYARPVARVLATFCGLVAAGCGKDPVKNIDAGAQLTIVARPVASDTVDAHLVDSLTVQVEDVFGRPASGIAVMVNGGLEPPPAAYMEVWHPALELWVRAGVFTTDSRGRFSAAVRMGSMAGPAKLVVSIHHGGMTPEHALPFTIAPGQLHHIVATPSDTTLLRDQTYTLTTRPVDRNGNERSDVVTLRSSDHKLNVASDGRVTTLVEGLGNIVMTVGAFQATAGVTIMPLRRIAVAALDRIILFDTQGANRREIRIPNTYQFTNPSWHPRTGELIVVRAEAGTPARLVAIDTVTGNFRPVITSTSGIGNVLWPQVSSDGSYIYFVNDDTRGSYEMSRVRFSDGAVQRLWSMGYGALPPSAASPSPDQGRAVMPMVDGSLWMLNMLSHTADRFRSNAWYPQWSPNDDRIAFHATDGLRMVRADGTGERFLMAGDRHNYPEFDWSFDGEWIVATVDGLVLINTTTGEVLPLRFSRHLDYGLHGSNDGVSIR